MPYCFPAGSRFGADNLVLHASARRHVLNDLPGPLSIKTVIDGRVAWTNGGQRFEVDHDSFLVLGDGERYSMNIDEPKPVTTCCVFFRGGFVEQAAQDATTPLESALDNPARKAPPLLFLSRLHPGGHGEMLRRVHSLAPRCAAELQPSSFEQDFFELAHDLLGLYSEVTAQMARVPAAKASTREELFRRLQLARQFLHDHSGDQASLEQAARAAWLSPYHFHRAFRQAFGETPHAWLTSIRLARARESLGAGRTVLEACLESGFSSEASFSRLFRSRFGVAPSSLRWKRNSQDRTSDARESGS
ncbi:MAG: AraC family transcriptional regulator [Bryobacteraceae bacterium]